MSNDDVSRMFMPQRKVVTRSSSSSSLASNSSTSSTSTVTSANDAAHTVNGEVPPPAKKKQRGGFWPVSKAESTSGVTNARANGAVQPTNTNGVNALTQKGMQPAVPDHASNAANGIGPRPQNTAMLALLPMNGTFERKQINVPIHPDPPQKIGRQTNNKTTPKQDNGYFDSKVLSRQHAEIWADASGRIWIRDVKSSNGTFVNGTRLSPENRESEPTELRQHDSLELGIDIVSEDQKTIVHHKVSAKVEFAGFPGKAGNALDLLSFGELDPSQGLHSPMSAPMAHSKSQQGRPMNGRGSVASSAVGGNMSAVSQRQANYWGAPLNIEQLVKQVGVEMRAAKQQAQDLDMARTYLTSILPADGSPAKLPPASGKENQQPRQASGRVKAPRIDHSARFADPPAPPPQQPLPEKPDGGKAGSPASGLLKRENTAKPLLNGINTSPTSGQSSQILTLLESLKEAQKQIESQGSKVKELEDMLKQERQARQAAEEKVRRLEESGSAKPVILQEEPTKAEDAAEHDNKDIPIQQESSKDESALQQRIDTMLSEMQIMQKNMEQTTERAETAESERSSLAAMIERYRQEREDAEAGNEAVMEDESIEEIVRSHVDVDRSPASKKERRQPNGHVQMPKLPEHLQQAVTTILQQQQQQSDGEVPAHYAPYVSMMGVVLLGVGIMAYLNSWQKVDK
ncbi:hypothetical protein PMZ80_010645 [Knufia obscura]|uniref:FHA domain-containing protein n=1 Tax=Knufia obscura TaxID=1635080 RepID=A0ABR0R8Z3_9EURO|nr:hypothetical protein PMZ80_010645 [Knufia obscura]